MVHAIVDYFFLIFDDILEILDCFLLNLQIYLQFYVLKFQNVLFYD